MSRASVVQATMLRYINENPHTIKAYQRAVVDNGYGVNIPNLSVSPTLNTLGVARIARRTLPDPYISGAKTPYDYKDVYYLLIPYDATWTKKGIVFEYAGNKFKTRIPEHRKMFGETTYIICGLEQVTSGDAGDYDGQ